MSSIVAHAQRLLVDQRGTMLVEYSSLVLLIAIAALAILSQAGGGLPD